MDNRKQRSIFVDIVKGFAIISVVLLHVDFTWPRYTLLNISSLLGWFWHVPVFFCIGGFFIKEEKLLSPVSFIKHKVKSLYLLALYIYLPATLLHNLLFRLGWYTDEISYGGKIIHEWSLSEYVVNTGKTLLCAGREPIMGAMWFVYALLFALCGFSVISYIAKRFSKNETQYEWTRLLTLLSLQTASCIATQKFGITVPRFSNAVTAMLLLYVGQQANNRLKMTFTSRGGAVLAAFVFYQSTVLIGNGIIGLNHNNYHDVLQLTVGCFAVTYLLCFIAKKMENTGIGKIIAACGKDSFYIMGLHIVGFKVFSMFLLHSGVIDGGLERLMTPQIGHNIPLLVAYTLAGVIIPMATIRLFRKAGAAIQKRRASSLSPKAGNEH